MLWEKRDTRLYYTSAAKRTLFRPWLQPWNISRTGQISLTKASVSSRLIWALTQFIFKPTFTDNLTGCMGLSIYSIQDTVGAWIPTIVILNTLEYSTFWSWVCNGSVFKWAVIAIAMVPTIPKPNHWKSEQNGRYFALISNGFGQNGCHFVQNRTPLENHKGLPLDFRLHSVFQPRCIDMLSRIDEKNWWIVPHLN